MAQSLGDTWRERNTHHLALPVKSIMPGRAVFTSPTFAGREVSADARGDQRRGAWRDAPCLEYL